MNPYAPPIVEQQPSPQVRKGSLKNPARFLLYPLAGLCILFFLAMGWQYLQNGFGFTTVDFLNAGAGSLMGLFGISALFLGVRKLSKNTRLWTILWSAAAFSILGISLFFEPPGSIQDFVLISAVGSILLVIAFLAFRSLPEGSLPQDAIGDSEAFS